MKEKAKNTNRREKNTIERSKIFFTWKETPISDAFLNKMIAELPDYFDQPENYNKKSISAYYFSLHIPRTTYYEMLEKYPKLKAAHNIAMQKIGERLWEKSTEKQLDWRAVSHRLYKYGAELKEDYTFHQEAAKEIEESGPQWQVIQMVTEKTDELDKFMAEQPEKERRLKEKKALAIKDQDDSLE